MDKATKDHARLVLTIASDLTEAIRKAERLGLRVVVRTRVDPEAGYAVEVTIPSVDVEPVPSDQRWEQWFRIVAEEAGCSRDVARRAVIKAMAEPPSGWTPEELADAIGD